MTTHEPSHPAKTDSSLSLLGSFFQEDDWSRKTCVKLLREERTLIPVFVLPHASRGISVYLHHFVCMILIRTPSEATSTFKRHEISSHPSMRIAIRKILLFLLPLLLIMLLLLLLITIIKIVTTITLTTVIARRCSLETRLRDWWAFTCGLGFRAMGL